MKDNQLQKHENADKIKWILTLVAFILIGVTLVGIICGLLVKKKATSPIETEQSAAMDESEIAVVNRVRPLSVMPYATVQSNPESNGVHKPSQEELTADVNAYKQQTNYGNVGSRYDYPDPLGLTVMNNIDSSTSSTVYTMGITFLISRATDFLTLLFPKWNPFETLEDAYEVRSISVADNVGKIDSTSLQYYYALTLNRKSSEETKIKGPIMYDLVPVPISLPKDPVKEGYTFVGWYYGTQDEHGTGTSCTAYNGEPIYANTALHAHFQIKTFTVTFDKANGSVAEKQTVDWNTSVSTSTLEWEGHEFLGWYLSDGTRYTGQAITKDTTLTAHWKLQRFTVTFYVDGEEYKSMEVEYGTSFTDVMKSANNLGLRVKSLSSSNGEAVGEFVTGNLNVNAAQMSSTDKALNTAKSNTWAVVGGIVGVVALFAAIGVIIGAIRRRHSG